MTDRGFGEPPLRHDFIAPIAALAMCLAGLTWVVYMGAALGFWRF